MTVRRFRSIGLGRCAGSAAAALLLILLAGFWPGAIAGCSPGDVCIERTALNIRAIDRRTVDKVDILLAIDNSRSMADKQQILAEAVPDLVLGLVNPPCVDKSGIPGPQPPGPLDPCDAGLRREIDPIVDIHIGVVTSSLGGHGADSCPDQDTSTGDCGTTPNYTNNDHGHLIARGDPCNGWIVPTYLDQGFLAWDPMGKLNPPGEAVFDNGTSGLVPNLRNMVIGAGQIGCGFESQLESWYRFLVEPEPAKHIQVINGYATPDPDYDLQLIMQRSQFLRPDSLLAIIMLTDENDCSIKVGGQNYYAAQLSNGGMPFHLPKARAACETNPNDPCCYSCGQTNIPASCPPDPTCTDSSGQVVYLNDLEDPVDLRCWDQKRRFGIDFLYPIDRYVQALTSHQIPNRSGQLVPNPLFWDLNPMDELRSVRDPSLVFLAGIVGVPWQDIARDPNDPAKGFKNAHELSLTDPNLGGKNVWDVILGDPAAGVKPLDPLMIESILPRSGTNPITGDPLQPPGSPTKNPINGNEWTISNNDELQFACIFPLGTPRDCAMSSQLSCDCSPGQAPDNPLCQGTTQVHAKAYPGLRELSVLKGLGSQGIAASICAPQTSDPTRADYGYRPAVTSILERINPALARRCLTWAITPQADGQIACDIIEARWTGGSCQCDANEGRRAVAPERQNILDVIEGWNCYCEVVQLEGEERAACQNDSTAPPPGDGFCYVDATTTPPTGNPDLVADCPSGGKHTIRFAGNAEPKPGSTVFINCGSIVQDCSGG